jgi:NTE family protein
MGFLQAQCALLPETFFGPFTDRAIVRWLDFLTKLRRPHTHLGASAVDSWQRSAVDFDRLNAGRGRFSVGAVNVRTGIFVYFDTTTHTSALSTSWPAERCRPAFRQWRSRANTIGTAALSPTPRCNGWSTEKPRRDTLSFQVNCRTRAASFHPTRSKS